MKMQPPMNTDNTRIEDQTINRFEQLINQMNAGFSRLENTLKSDINRVEGQTIKWLFLLIAVAVIILSLLTYFKG